MTHSTVTQPIPEPAPEPGRASGRRTAVIAGVTAATLVVVGVGAYAAMNFLSGGRDAEAALPASTLAVASIDLDPGALQKVEAIKTFRKFPGLRKELKISSGDDLRRVFFEQAVKDSDCKGLTYDADIKPWIGDSAALGAVPFGSKQVVPVVALAVSDEDKADAAFKKLSACDSGKGDDTGWAFGDGFALISDSTAHAQRAVSEAKTKPLSDDAGYQEWTGKAGDRGIVGFYVAKAAAAYLADQAGSLVPGMQQFPDDLPSSEMTLDPSDFPSDFPSGFPTDFPTDLPSDLASLPTDLPSGINTPLDTPGSQAGAGASAPYRTGRSDDSTDKLKQALKRFQGAAGSLRFADGGMELEVVGGGLPQQSASHDGGALVASLPKDTAAAVGIGVPSDFAEKLVKNLNDLDIPFLGSGGQLTDQLESQLGLALPEDLQTLLGKGLALSLGGTAPSDLSGLSDPSDVPVGLTVKDGDADAIKEVLGKLEQRAGAATGGLQIDVEQGSGKVALALDKDYAASLKQDGALGDQKRFSSVVPHADDAQLVAFVDFDSDWARTLSKSADAKDRENLDPLQALGLSVWKDGGTSHLLLKVTTD